MIHYNVWFTLKQNVVEADGLGAVRSFLTELKAVKEIAEFHLLRNSAEPPKTILLRYQAQVEFSDTAQFSTTFAALRASDIHEGPHGAMLAMIAEFHVEVFAEVEAVAV